MKLALALSERADLQEKIGDLAERLNKNAKVQEGEKPTEDPNVLIGELDSCYERLEVLIAKINHTNDVTMCGDVSLVELLAKRECLLGKIQKMKSFLLKSSDLIDRYYTKSEVRIYSTVPVAELQEKLDALCKEYRTLDDKIQELNWTTELI